MTGPLLSVASLSAGYGSREVLHGVSFELRAGERLSVIGPNGCGKTTLLRALAGVVPYRGSVLLRDKRELSSVGRKEAAREIAFLSQISPAYPDFTVRETVAMGRYARSPRGLFAALSSEDGDAVRKALADTGLEAISGEPLARLSGGQLQRVFLARSLAQGASILLLDEPTNHLDLSFQIDFLDLIALMVASGAILGTIGVFHDLVLAARFADRQILLAEGTIRAEGTPAGVLAGPEIGRAYGMDVRGAIGNLLQTGGNLLS